MRIAIDLDNTLVDEFGKSVRPGIRGLLERLVAANHTLIVFTHSTEDRCQMILRDHGLRGLFAELFCRERWDPELKNPIKDLRMVNADAIVDDDPRNIAFAESVGKRGVLVASYRGQTLPANDLDHLEELLRANVFAALKRMFKKTASRPKFRPGP